MGVGDGDGPAQLLPGPVQAHPSGAGGDAEDGGRITDSELVDCDQLEHVPKRWGQLVEQAVDPPGLPFRVDPFLCALDRVWLQHAPTTEAPERPGLPGSAPKFHRHAVPGNAEDPGTRWPQARVVAGRRLDHRNEDVRSQIGRGVWVVYPPRNKPLHRLHVVPMERFEEVRVSPDATDVVDETHAPSLPKCQAALHTGRAAPGRWPSPSRSFLALRLGVMPASGRKPRTGRTAVPLDS